MTRTKIKKRTCSTCNGLGIVKTGKEIIDLGPIWTNIDCSGPEFFVLDTTSGPRLMKKSWIKGLCPSCNPMN